MVSSSSTMKFLLKPLWLLRQRKTVYVSIAKETSLKEKRKINWSFLRHDTDDSLPEILIALLFFLLHVAHEAQYAWA